MNLIVTNDRKKALTREEFKEVKKIFESVTEVITTRRNDKRINNKKVYFNCMLIKKFSEFPSIIARVHEKFGRTVEIETYWGHEDDIIEVWFRGYSEELR